MMLSEPWRGVASNGVDNSDLGVKRSVEGGDGVTDGVRPRNDSNGLNLIDPEGVGGSMPLTGGWNGDGRGIEVGAFDRNRGGVLTGVVVLIVPEAGIRGVSTTSITICGPR